MSSEEIRQLALHNHVRSLAPLKVKNIEKYLSASYHFIVAIERHDRENWVDEPQDSFLWIKARAITTIDVILDSYLQNLPDPRINILLRIGNFVPAPFASLAQLDFYNDQYVVLTAVRGAPIVPTPSQIVGSNDGGQMQSLVPPPAAINGVPAGPAPPGLANGAESRTHALPNVQLPLPNGTLFGPDDHTQRLGHVPMTTVPLLTNGGPSGTQRVSPAINRTPLTQESTKSDADMPISGEESVRIKEEASERQPSLASNSASGSAPTEFEEVSPPNQGNEVSQRGKPLRELALGTVPERLEAGVAAGLKMVGSVETQLQKLPHSQDALAWLSQIEKIRQDAVKTKTVVGVVGNTGAGKSSIVNALLDEERLVPTNCMRACTAVVTELSYNESNAEDAKYRAEIEFIGRDDWLKELTVLHSEVFSDREKPAREAYNADTEASIAFAKIRAVYNSYTNEELLRTTVDKLMDVKHVASILGTTRRIKEKDPAVFYRRLNDYVDSKEKGSEQRDSLGRVIVRKARAFEYWPLIKVVKIYTKADALSTGAVIVDLPGVHDHNAARAAVAESYLKQCSGLWIVAPITRAVDDKAAKTLLGDTFKRQLQYDGTYSAVTFICSKTDDISRTEAMDSLAITDEMTAIDDKIAAITRKRRELRDQIRIGRESKDGSMDDIDKIENQLEIWEELQSKAEAGQSVYAPGTNGSKRKRPHSSEGPPNKKARSDEDGRSEDANDGQNDKGESGANDVDDAADPPLTLDEIERKLAEMKAEKKEVRSGIREIDENIRLLQERLTAATKEETALDQRQNQLCIVGRNKYARDAIRQDFAAGIKELDQENAMEDDEENFNPDVDMRDYDEVAKSLKVFCVSSRSYQKLCGRFSKDNDVVGFSTMDETEIPALQKHCKSLTENGRAATCRRFLNNLDQMLASLGLWTSSDGTTVQMTMQRSDSLQTFLSTKLAALLCSLEVSVAEIIDEVSMILKEQIFDEMPNAAELAARQAPPTYRRWGSSRNEGGLHYMTYKAIVRRHGVHSGASGLQDFNAQLTEPITKRLAANWERAIHRRVSPVVLGFARTGARLLKEFHATVETHCQQHGYSVARLSLLGQNVRTYETVLADLAREMVQKVGETQRDINREFTPPVTEAMEPAYQLCSDESGKGSFMRMKDHMATHVDRQLDTMFHEACNRVRTSLTNLCETIRQTMLQRLKDVVQLVHRDYLSIVGSAGDGDRRSANDHAARGEIDHTISAFDDVLQGIIDSSLDDLMVLRATAAAEQARVEEDELEDDRQLEEQLWEMAHGEVSERVDGAVSDAVPHNKGENTEDRRDSIHAEKSGEEGSL